MLVERLTEKKVELHKPALETLRVLIRTSTSSMTSVPKPLKFLRPHYSKMIEIYTSWPESETRKFLADILSVLAMSFADESARNSIKYRLLGTKQEAGLWGHEYVRHLSSELIGEFNALSDLDQGTEILVKEALELVPFFLKHNAEADACDLLLELELLEKLPSFIDKDTYKRVCLYIIG